MDYGEIRHVIRERIWNGVKNEHIETATQSYDVGVFVRVWHEGAWGAAATQELSEASIQAVTKRSIAIAAAGRAVHCSSSGCNCDGSLCYGLDTCFG